MQRTEKNSARLLIMCYAMKESSAFIVDPSPARYALVILSLLPWLYTKRADDDVCIYILCASFFNFTLHSQSKCANLL